MKPPSQQPLNPCFCRVLNEHPNTTILFVALCDYAKMTHDIDGMKDMTILFAKTNLFAGVLLVQHLHQVFSSFDNVVAEHDSYKVESIGEV